MAQEMSPLQVIKQKLNTHATAYALASKETPESLFHRKEALELAYSMFKQADNGNWYFFNKNLGEDALGISVHLIRWLDAYDPYHEPYASFSTYMSGNVDRLIRDHIKNPTGTIEIPSDVLDTQANESMEQDFLESYSALQVFGRFGRILQDREALLEGVRSYQGKKGKYRVFFTRDCLLLICPEYDQKACMLIKKNVDGSLSQPYILYTQDETLENAAACEERIASTTVPFCGVDDLLALYHSDKLIPERYKSKGSLNLYLGKSNQSEVLNHYEELRREFFRKLYHN